MAGISLSASPRETIGRKVKALREAGKTPCVTYGHGVKSVNLEIDSRVFEAAYKAAGKSTLVELKIGDEIKNVVINDVQLDPVSGKVIHADLYQVKMDEKIHAEVPLIFEGTSKAVKDLGGILVKAVDSLEIEALPKDLPHDIKVDLSILETFEDKVLLKDLPIPDGVEVLMEDKELSIVSVDEPRSEEELKALEDEVTEDVDSVEGVKKDEGEDVTEDDGEEGDEKSKEGADESAGDAEKSAPEAEAKKEEPKK